MSPERTAERAPEIPFQPSLRDGRRITRKPSVETLRYFRLSVRDNGRGPVAKFPKVISPECISSLISQAVSMLAVALLFVLGCSSSREKSKSNEFFVQWLQSHGETNIVIDGHGVGLAGNATRLHSSLYGSEKQRDGTVTAETEFRVRLPDGREIIEFVAGTGDSPGAAENDSKLNFLLSTFHVVYRAFMNPADSHQTEEKVTINGKARVMIMGDSMTRSQTTNGSPDMFPLRSQFREVLSPLSLSPECHWIKIVYAQHNSNVMACSVTLDNLENAALTQTVRKLPWPVQQEFYMVKQFIVVK